MCQGYGVSSILASSVGVLEDAGGIGGQQRLIKGGSVLVMSPTCIVIIIHYSFFLIHALCTIMPI